MIRNITEKRLKRLYESRKVKGLPNGHEEKLKVILHWLDQASSPEDLKGISGLNLKTFTSSNRSLKGYWQVEVRDGHRVRFRFEAGHVTDVWYGDPH